MRIFKYELAITDRQVVQLPKGAHCLAAQTQNEKLMLWALVDELALFEGIEFRLIGTGHPIEDDPATLRYIGTAQMLGGQLIWHVFEKVAI